MQAYLKKFKNLGYAKSHPEILLKGKKGETLKKSYYIIIVNPFLIFLKNLIAIQLLEQEICKIIKIMNHLLKILEEFFPDSGSVMS